MRSRGKLPEMLSERIRVLFLISIRCEIQYGMMGATGFLYESAKDNIKWKNLSIKKYISDIMFIGRMTVLSDEKWGEYMASMTAKKQTKKDANVALLAFFK